MTMLHAAEQPLIVAGGGIINADASDLLVEFAEITGVPVIPTLMGWGCIPDDHPLMAGMVGLQTSHRYGNATFLKSDFVLGIGNRWANRHTGTIESYTKGRQVVHVDIEPTQIGRVFNPDYGIVSDAKAALELFVEVAEERKAAGSLKDRHGLGAGLRAPQDAHAAPHPLRPGAAEAAAGLSGDERGLQPRHLLRDHDRPVADRRARSSCTSISRATGSIAGRPVRSAGPCPRRLACARPIRTARSWPCRATTTSSS